MRSKLKYKTIYDFIAAHPSDKDILLYLENEGLDSNDKNPNNHDIWSNLRDTCWIAYNNILIVDGGMYDNNGVYSGNTYIDSETNEQIHPIYVQWFFYYLYNDTHNFKAWLKFVHGVE